MAPSLPDTNFSHTDCTFQRLGLLRGPPLPRCRGTAAVRLAFGYCDRQPRGHRRSDLLGGGAAWMETGIPGGFLMPVVRRKTPGPEEGC